MKIAGPGHPHPGPAADHRHRPVQQDEIPTNPAGQKGGVLVLGRAHQPEPFHRQEIVRGGQRHRRPLRAERGIGDHPTIELIDPSHPRIFHTPGLLRVARRRSEQRCGINDPVRYPIGGPGHGEMTDPPPVLHPAHQHGPSVNEGGARVHHRVHRVRPPLPRQHRVTPEPDKEVAVRGGAGPSHHSSRPRA